MMKIPKELYGYLILAAAIIVGSSIVGLSVYEAAKVVGKLSLQQQQYDPLAHLKTYSFPEIDSYDPRYGTTDNVILFEYTDYQCPFCRRHTLQTFPEIKKNYIDTGKISYVYKDFPLPFHQYALPAAKYANCVYKEYGLEVFSKFKTWLFENRDQWTNENFTTVIYEELNKLGLDINKVEQCVNSTEVQEDIREDLQEVNAFRLTGTPSFVIAIKAKNIDNNEFEELEDIIDEWEGYGVRMKLGKTKDNKYVFVIFSGALPYDVFNKILEIGTS